MSASLVGSEMCIRDRVCAASARSQQEGAIRRGVNATAQLPARFGPLSTACLLYTSDAADDM
eukprot:1893060-Alexandrium_andersonii.AAC.1